ncbi:hypothetical protein BX667DRAFT_349239 [Coemansia mojavensis]|nr:hypothetical protein BX667DRAFT_349239 [Coemansia mojavensis]
MPSSPHMAICLFRASVACCLFGFFGGCKRIKAPVFLLCIFVFIEKCKNSRLGAYLSLCMESNYVFFFSLCGLMQWSTSMCTCTFAVVPTRIHDNKSCTSYIYTDNCLFLVYCSWRVGWLNAKTAASTSVTSANFAEQKNLTNF